MAEDDRRVFAKRLASLVRKSKITIAELAKASHTSKETAIAYLSGEAFPKVCRWRAIAVLLGLRSVNDLFPRIDVDPVLFRERKRDTYAQGLSSRPAYNYSVPKRVSHDTRGNGRNAVHRRSAPDSRSVG